MKPAIVILAGGRGTRLGGVRKADLRFGGTRLLDHLESILAPHGAELMVSTGPIGSPAIEVLTPWTPVCDGTDGLGGPLAGILAAAAALKAAGSNSATLISVAVDTPLLPADFVKRLRSALAPDTRAAYCTWNDNFYPTNAIWRLETLSHACLAEHGAAFNSARSLLNGVSAPPVDWSADHPFDPFSTLNTMADLIALTQRAWGAERSDAI